MFNSSYIFSSIARYTTIVKSPTVNMLALKSRSDYRIVFLSIHGPSITLKLALFCNHTCRHSQRVNMLPCNLIHGLKASKFIKMSKSASMPFITCRTPISPLMLNPQTQRRPTKTNLARRARALNTSAAPRIWGSNMMYVLSPTANATSVECLKTKR
jgi:hypothetical protein